MVDTVGLLVVVAVTAASAQDRDGGGRPVLETARMAMPSIAVVRAGRGYAGRAVAFARQMLRIIRQIGRRPDGRRTFEVLPRRWVVERTLSWISRCRRLDHDYDRLPAYAETMVHSAMIGIMIRRLAPAPGRRPWQSGTIASQDLKHLLRGTDPRWTAGRPSPDRSSRRGTLVR